MCCLLCLFLAVMCIVLLLLFQCLSSSPIYFHLFLSASLVSLSLSFQPPPSIPPSVLHNIRLPLPSLSPALSQFLQFLSIVWVYGNSYSRGQTFTFYVNTIKCSQAEKKFFFWAELILSNRLFFEQIIFISQTIEIQFFLNAMPVGCNAIHTHWKMNFH